MTNSEFDTRGDDNVPSAVGGAAVELCAAGLDKDQCDGTTAPEGCDLACFADKNSDQDLGELAKKYNLTMSTQLSTFCMVNTNAEPVNDDQNEIRRCLGKFGATSVRFSWPGKYADCETPIEPVGTAPSPTRDPEHSVAAAPPLLEIKNLPTAKEDYSFKTFVESSVADRLLVQTAEVYSQAPGGSTVSIVGESGLGKTHLLTAMFQEFVANNPSKKSIFLSGSTFKDLYSGACGYGGRDDFRLLGYNGFMKYFKEELDAIFLDDLQGLATGSSEKFLEIVKAQRADQLIVCAGADRTDKVHAMSSIKLNLELPSSEKERRTRLIKIIERRIANLPPIERFEYDDLVGQVLKALRSELDEGDTVCVDSFINMLRLQIQRNIKVDERVDYPVEQLLIFKQDRRDGSFVPSDADEPFVEKYKVEKPNDIGKIIDFVVKSNIIKTGKKKKTTDDDKSKPGGKKASTKKPKQSRGRRKDSKMTPISDLFQDVTENL
jgi:hypothetical protein